MRNTLKFSLFGTVLCAMSMMFNAGYSVEYNNNSFDSTNSSYSAESEDEFMDRVGKIIKAADKYGSVIRGKDGAMTVGRFGTVTKAEMDRYNEIMKQRDEKLIRKVEKFYEDTRNNEYMQVGNILIGNAGESSITVDEEKRYEEIMQRRNNNLTTDKSSQEYDIQNDSNDSWNFTFAGKSPKIKRTE